MAYQWLARNPLLWSKHIIFWWLKFIQLTAVVLNYISENPRIPQRYVVSLGKTDEKTKWSRLCWKSLTFTNCIWIILLFTLYIEATQNTLNGKIPVRKVWKFLTYRSTWITHLLLTVAHETTKEFDFNLYYSVIFERPFVVCGNCMYK